MTQYEMIWQIMSDKQNNLNKDDNVQLDKMTNEDQETSDALTADAGETPIEQSSSIKPPSEDNNLQVDKVTNENQETSDVLTADAGETPLEQSLPSKPPSEDDNTQFDKVTNENQETSDALTADAGETPLEQSSPSKPSKEDDNIQFDTVSIPDQQATDSPPISAGTAPLKRLSPRTPLMDSLNNKSAGFVKRPISDRLPLTGKLRDLSEINSPDESKADKPLEFPSITKDVLPSQSTPVAKSETDKPIDSTPVAADIPLKQKPLDDAQEASITPETNVDNAPKTSDTPDKPKEIPFPSPSEVEEDKPITHARRSPPDNVQDKSSFLTFGKQKPEAPPEKNPDTAILPDHSPSWKKVIDGQSQGTTGTIGEQREILFVIRGMIERVVMKDNTTATLGRFDTGTIPNAEIDLIPYGAIDRGVSRRHCEVLLRDNQLHVVDLGSTNGTFLAGVRLNPNEPTLLRKGDELLLGRLAVQVLFR
jgi:hypothetical protein